MSKFRLLKAHKIALENFAWAFVRDRTPDKAADLRRDLVAGVMRAIEVRYPAADMAVLARYSMASAPSKLSIYFGDRDGWTDSVRADRTGRRPYYTIEAAFGMMPSGSGRTFGLPEGTALYQVYNQVYLLDEQRTKQVKADTQPFLTLIQTARNLEDIEAEWPEVGVWRERWGVRGNQLPSTLTPDALEVLAAVRRREPSATPLADVAQA